MDRTSVRYRGRHISGVSTANPQCIWNKTLRARLAASLQCRDVLKSAVMVTPRSFAQSTVDIAVPSATDKGNGGVPLLRRVHIFLH